jgi:ADP-ribose pyrophosphatase YjhB (NUDIX family)
VPAGLNGVPFAPWCPPENGDAWWEAEAARAAVPEPVFNCPAGKKPAAGAVVLEPDGRAWIVAPTNRFGGHEFTMPKGRVDGNRGLAATALVEVFEEVGLQVELQIWLCDVPRSLTFTRFYVAYRVGGSPAAMGWESQSVVLAPVVALRMLLTHPGDQQVLDAFDRLIGDGTSDTSSSSHAAC